MLFPAKIISPGRGSSGFYTAEALRQAATNKVFKKGTQMFWNHATREERAKRPEGDMSMLAARFTEDARWEEQGVDGPGLYTEIEVFSDYAQQVIEKGPHTGLSIVAFGDVEEGKVGDFEGPIVKSISSAQSVDFVTRAGRDGKVLFEADSTYQGTGTLLVESATVELNEAANVAEWLESRIHLIFTQFADDMFGDGRVTRNERITMSGAISDALTAFNTRMTADVPQLFTRGRWEMAPEEEVEVSEASKLGNFLAKKRDEQDLTNDDLAKAAGVAVSTMQGILSGEIGRPPDSRLRGLARRLDGVSFDDLVNLLPATSQEESYKEKDMSEIEKLKAQLALLEAQNQSLQEQATRHNANSIVANIWADEKYGRIPAAMRQLFETNCLANLPMTESGQLDKVKLSESLQSQANTYLESLPAQAPTVTGNGAGSGGGDVSTMRESAMERLKKQHPNLTEAQIERAYLGGA